MTSSLPRKMIGAKLLYVEAIFFALTEHSQRNHLRKSSIRSEQQRSQKLTLQAVLELDDLVVPCIVEVRKQPHNYFIFGVLDFFPLQDLDIITL
jgi:hypothetical protein